MRYSQIVLQLCLILGVGCTLAEAAEKPKWNLSLKPALMQESSEDITAGALKFDGKIRYDLGLAPRDDLAISLESKGAVATDARANSENLYAALHFGYSHQFSSWKTVVTTNRTSGRPGARPVKRLAYDFGGLLDLFLKTRFETDQPWNNYNLTYGPHLGFSPMHQTNLSYLVPSFYVDYQRVEVLYSRYNEQHGISDRSFWRFDASAGWFLPVGTWFLGNIPWLKPLDVQYDLHYYRAFDLPTGASSAGLDDAYYHAVTLGYNLRILAKNPEAEPWWKPAYAYVSVGDGRLPPNPHEQTSVYIGLVFLFGN